MMDWFRFVPQDTLFFRGSEPANMGESHSATAVFPPPAHTIAGALRTMALVQNNIAFADYGQGRFANQAVVDAIGNAGEATPFNVIGPLFRMGGKIWVPCPFSWYCEKNDSGLSAIDSKKKIKGSAPLKSALIRTASSDRLRWVKGCNTETLGGNWVEIQDLFSESEDKKIMSKGAFFVSEIHTGIALEAKLKRRTARDGHLYSFIHSRLCQGVELIFGIDRTLPISNRGVMKLGAEQRFGLYEKIAPIEIPRGKTGLFMTLSILAGSEEANRTIVATGKIQYHGGWDLHRKFHKPMIGHFPAGSVFDKQINNNCIEL